MFKAVVFAFVLVTAASANAGTSSGVELLMEVSGTNKQFAEFPEAFIAGVKQGLQSGESADAEVVALLLDSARREVTAERFLAPVRRQFSEQLDEQAINTLIAWHQSPVGERVTQAEVQASTPQANEHMLALAPQLLQDDAAVQRADRMDAAVGMTDMMMEVQENVTLIVMQASAAASEQEEPIDEEAFRLQWEVVEPQVRANVRQYVLASAAYTYRNLSQSDIDAYVEFLSSPTGQAFTAAGKRGIAEGFAVTIDAWTRDWVERLPSLTSGEHQ